MSLSRCRDNRSDSRTTCSRIGKVRSPMLKERGDHNISDVATIERVGDVPKGHQKELLENHTKQRRPPGCHSDTATHDPANDLQLLDFEDERNSSRDLDTFGTRWAPRQSWQVTCKPTNHGLASLTYTGHCSLQGCMRWKFASRQTRARENLYLCKFIRRKEHGFGVRYSKQWQRENKHMAKATTQSFGH